MTQTAKAAGGLTSLPAARVRHLTKTYGEGAALVTALDGVTLDIAAGEFTAVMGPSGSGKSTLMHCCAALDVPTSGQVFIGDTEIGSLSDKELTRLRRERIGFVFQSFNLVPTLTAEREHPAAALDRGSQAGPRVVRHASSTPSTSATGCTTGPTQLSGGQQQRVAVARALTSRPDDRLRRRAHRQPRLPLGRGGAGAAAALRRDVRPDHRDGHPRPGRRGLHRPGRVPGRRTGRRTSCASPTREAVLEPDGAHESTRRRTGRLSMLRAAWKSLLGRKVRLLMSTFAIVLGVAFVAGTLIFTDTLQQELRRHLRQHRR